MKTTTATRLTIYDKNNSYNKIQIQYHGNYYDYDDDENNDEDYYDYEGDGW